MRLKTVLFSSGLYVGILALSACGGGSSSSSGQATPDTVDDPPPAITFSSSATSIDLGETATLTWSADNASSCTASGGWVGNKATSGSESVGPLDASTTFVISCSGAGGGSLREVAIAVGADTVASVTLRASEPVVLIGGQVELTWSSENATSCIAGGTLDWDGPQPVSGAFTTSPLGEDATFKLTCSGTATSAVALATVTVTDPVLRWEAPTEHVDGRPLEVISSYNVYWGSASGEYASSVALGGTVTQWEVDLPAGEYFLRSQRSMKNRVRVTFLTRRVS